MAATRDQDGTPPAVIHKRILDLAAERPDASMAELADGIGGASVDLVERVLEEYGDPGGNDDGTDEHAAAQPASDTLSTSGDEEADDGSTAVDQGTDATIEATAAGDGTDVDTGDGEELSAKQQEVLEAIYAHPDASQRELGERLGVSASTVNNRLSAVEDFEWNDRWRFVRERYPGATDGGGMAIDHEALEELRERLTIIESQVEELRERDDSAPEPGPPLPPEIAYKVAHACLSSDRLDEVEELAVLRMLLDAEG